MILSSLISFPGFGCGDGEGRAALWQEIYSSESKPLVLSSLMLSLGRSDRIDVSSDDER